MLFGFKRARVLFLLEVRAVAAVLDRDLDIVGWVDANDSWQREDLQGLVEGDCFGRHSGEQGTALGLVFTVDHFAELHVGAEAAVEHIDGHVGLGVVAERDRALGGFFDVVDGLVDRELVWRNVVGDRRGVSGVVWAALATLDVGAELADSGNDHFAVFGHAERNGVDRTRIDLAETLVDLVLEAFGLVIAKVEVLQPWDRFAGAACDVVEIAFHAAGVGVIDQVGEMLLEQTHDRERSERRNEG